MQILLLEPDKILASSYQQALAAAGHIVHWHSQAQAALASLESHPTHLIIVELQLVGHSGLEFLHELRSYTDWDHIPVLLHTLVAPASLGLRPAAWQQLGIADYLYKPHTSLENLVRIVNRQPQRNA